MAKFCSKCNSPLNEGDRVCGYCGTPVAEAPASAPAKKSKVDLAKIMKDPKAKKFAPVAVVAAVIAVIVIIVAIASNAGYKGVAKKNLNAMIKNNPDKYVKTMSALRFDEEFDEEDMEEYKKDFEENIKDLYDELDDEYGENAKIKYDIIGSYDILEEDLEYIEDELDERGIDYGKNIQGKMVVVLLTVEGNGKEETTCSQMLLIKEDGKWKVYRGIGL